jgi:hypothetical protein
MKNRGIKLLPLQDSLKLEESSVTHDPTNTTFLYFARRAELDSHTGVERQFFMCYKVHGEASDYRLDLRLFADCAGDSSANFSWIDAGVERIFVRTDPVE